MNYDLHLVILFEKKKQKIRPKEIILCPGFAAPSPQYDFNCGLFVQLLKREPILKLVTFTA
jgi:hypothetical protein